MITAGRSPLGIPYGLVIRSGYAFFLFRCDCGKDTWTQWTRDVWDAMPEARVAVCAYCGHQVVVAGAADVVTA